MLLGIIIFLLLFLMLTTFWRRRQARRRKQASVLQLRTWAAEHQALDPALQQWMKRLSATEAEVLFDLLNGYCTSLQWELTWLFAPQIKKAPALQAILEENVSAYARTILLALQMEADVQAYQAYVAFEQKPTDRSHRTLVEQLYVKVDDGGLTPQVKRFWGRFSRKGVTTKQQVTAIQQAFERDPAKAMAFLKEALSNDAAEVVQQARQELAPALMPNSAMAM